MTETVLSSEPQSSVCEIVDPEQKNAHPRDIGHLLKLPTRLRTAEAMREALTDRWVPSENEMPYSDYKGQKRTLSHHHLNKFPWLAISRVDGFAGAWCISCALFQVNEFAGHNKGQKLGALVTKPLIKYRKIVAKDGAFTVHQSTKFHQVCQIRMSEFLQRRREGEESSNSVTRLLDQHREEQVRKNRELLTPIVDTVLTMAREEIPFRGHRDDGRLTITDPMEADGNFRALLRMRIRAGDASLSELIETSRNNAQYTSKTVQNALLSAAAELVQEALLERIRKAKLYTILVDETTDLSIREQIVLAVRYVWEGTIREDVVCIRDLMEALTDIIGKDRRPTSSENAEIHLSGKNIAKVICNMVLKLKLNPENMVSQSFDGASVMKSPEVGVAAEIQRNFSISADYIHCLMHCTNLVAKQANKLPTIRNSLDIVRSTTSFFHSSAKRMKVLQEVISNDEDQHSCLAKKLKSFSTTRFTEKYSAIVIFKDLLSATIRALHLISAWSHRESSSQASQLLHAISQPCFIAALIAFMEISSLFKPLTARLQTPNQDIVQALSLVDHVQNALKGLRDQYSTVWNSTVTLAQELEVEMTPPRVPPKSKQRSNVPASSPEEYYRRNLFLPLVDSLLADMEARFSSQQQTAMKLAMLVPAHLIEKEYKWEDVQEAVQKYKKILPDGDASVKGEFLVWQQMWLRATEVDRPKNALTALAKTDAVALPNIRTLMQILCTIGCTTAEPERVFSTLKRTLTYLRTTMTEERLQSLILLSSHRDLQPTTNKVLDKFAAQQARRLQLIL